MLTGLVRGVLTATIQHSFYDGKKLLLVECTDEQGRPTGKELIAIDTVDAGPGQQVLLIDEGNSARSIVHSSSAPLRTAIVGIIDRLDASA